MRVISNRHEALKRGVLACKLNLAGFALLSCFVGQAQALTMAEIVQLGLQRNPEVKAANAKIKQFEIEIDIAKYGYLPVFDAAVGPTNGINNELGYEVNIRQVLYDWGRVDSIVDGATAEMRQQVASAVITKEDVAFNISELCLDLIAAKDKIAIINWHLVRVDRLRKISEERVEAGFSDRSELTKVKFELARTNELLIQERAKIRDVQRQLELLIGVPKVEIDEPELPILSSMFTEPANLEKAVLSSPIYTRDKEKINIEKAKVREADASKLPQLNLEATSLRREIGGQVLEDSILTFKFRMNSTQGLTNFKRADAARESLLAAEFDLDAAKQNITRKVQSLFELEPSLLMRERSLREQIYNGTELTEVYKEQFMANLRTMIEVLNSNKELFETELQLINIKTDRKRTPCRAAAQLGLTVPFLTGNLNESLSFMSTSTEQAITRDE